MSKLLAVLEEYSQAPSEKKSSISSDILRELENLITETVDENTKPNIIQENIDLLAQIHSKLDSSLFQIHHKEIFKFLINLSPENIYLVFHRKGIQISKQEGPQLEIKSVEDWIIAQLIRLIQQISVRELYNTVKAYIEEKHKNKAQAKLLLIEIIRYIIVNIDKKEAHLKEILPSLLKILNPSLRRYIKYKSKVENNQYVETPKYVDTYLQNYEKWAKDLIQNILDDLLIIIDPKQGERRLLLVKDLYDNFTYQSDIKRKEPSADKLITHYCVLFILDICEGLIDARNNAYFKKENIDSFLQSITETLLKIHPQLHDYIENFNMQLKILALDPKVPIFNKRDEMNLLIGDYDKYTVYNYGSMAYFAIKFIQRPKEAALLTTEYKLRLLLPSAYELYSSRREKVELKSEMLSTIQSLIKGYNEDKLIDNLNTFGTPLDKVLTSLLDFCGGFVDERDKSLGVEIFMTIKGKLTEKAQALLFVLLISNSRYHSLTEFILSEFKNGVTNALRLCPNDANVKEYSSPYLNLNLFRRFFDATANPESPSYKQQPEFIASFANISVLILIKYTNYLKNVPGYKTLAFKDSLSIFNYENVEILKKMVDKIQEYSSKLQENIRACQNQISQTPNTEENNTVVQHLNIKLNELLMIQDNITRISELSQELKSL